MAPVSLICSKPFSLMITAGCLLLAIISSKTVFASLLESTPLLIKATRLAILAAET